MGLILVTGGQGVLGREMTHELMVKGHSVIDADIDSLDITSEEALSSAFSEIDFDAVVNCACISSPEECENDPKLAHSVNAMGAKYLARECRKKDIPLIHISSGYVYESKKDEALRESDHTQANSAYSKSRLFGERFVIESGAKVVLIRTTWLFSRFGDNFIKNILKSAQSNNELSVVNDNYSCPTPARALAMDVASLVTDMCEGTFDKYGIYNYSSKTAVSRSALADYVLKSAYSLKILDHEVSVLGVASKDIEGGELRPKSICLNTSRFEKIFSIAMPDFAQYLEETLRGEKND